MKKFKSLLMVFIVLVSINTQAQSEIEISDERMEDFIKKMCRVSLTFRTSAAKQAGSNMEKLILNFGMKIQINLFVSMKVLQNIREHHSTF